MKNERKISETAIIVASLRALSQFESDERFNCKDDYAQLFLPDEKRIPLKDSQIREKIKKAIPMGMYEYVISRTKYFDNIFINALEQNIEQIVFLGAGFDSRPYRFSSLVPKTKIFEVDTEVTQQYKRSILLNKVNLAPNIKYVSANFEEVNLFSKLLENEYKRSDRTLFIWEGVTFYLTKDAVIRMLTEIRENSAPGSKVCFDFQTMKSMEELIKTEIKDESIKFGIEEGKIEEFVWSNEYRIIEHLNSKNIEQQFMRTEHGDFFGEIAPIMNFILIEH